MTELTKAFLRPRIRVGREYVTKAQTKEQVSARHSSTGADGFVTIQKMANRKPVSHRITFKLCLLTWKTLHTAHPLNLSELVTHYLPSKALHSSNTNLLARPSSITSNFTSWAFSVSAPSTWNSLPTHTTPLTNYQPSNVD